MADLNRWAKMESHRVVLVVDRLFGARVGELPEGTPAWVVDSPANHAAIVARWTETTENSQFIGPTSFKDSPELSPSDLAASMIGAIEMHHGPYSHEPPFSRLTVFGAAVSPLLTSNLAEIGFRLVSASASALEFAKEERPNQALQHNAGSRPSSGDSPASETPSSLGPRG